MRKRNAMALEKKRNWKESYEEGEYFVYYCEEH